MGLRKSARGQPLLAANKPISEPMARCTVVSLVTLRSSATVKNADKTLSSSRTTVYFQSTALADCPN